MIIGAIAQGSVFRDGLKKRPFEILATGAIGGGWGGWLAIQMGQRSSIPIVAILSIGTLVLFDKLMVS